LRVPSSADSTPAPDASGPVESAPPLIAEPSAPSPASLTEENFTGPGGVDEEAKPLREPEFALPWGVSSLPGWKVRFDLLIDAQGKVIRVDAVDSNAPAPVIGAVLAAFFVLPFEPAKLAGRPIASRQRFEVNP
jgi:hypothetical protein